MHSTWKIAAARFFLLYIHTYIQKHDYVHMYVSTYVNNMYVYAYLQNRNHNAYGFLFYFSLILL